MTVLQTARLRLRSCTPADRGDFLALELDPQVMRFLHGGAVDHATTDPEKVTFLMPRGTEPDVWTARRRDDDTFVGWFCLSVERDEVAEIGYRLRRDAWGKGYASEAASALVDLGFHSTGIEKIVACTMETNLGSRRVMEKIGMTPIRTVPFQSADFPGTDHRDVWYQLTRSEWQARIR
ncbi:GNAT family N-acetyltransferase [Rhizobium halophytocola]|uniref:RimJ/RimL family protein N-acetyltransferase n=1 Tax=Rhizobium halophytocola TaxID=735519 RepID=A0ABS4E5M1_9HYPH|nr:GNAT family N-acetyltransferase [Rhizobium halophytocola]MBP1853246.1 RimJ/RimL family protein N-acetyltransferase [Rhizobium halophytocola]